MKSYCVKQKKQTECVKGTEIIVKTKNNRSMLKCKCAECGITKTRFISQQHGGNIFSSAAKIGYKLGKRKDYHRMSNTGFSDSSGNNFRKQPWLYQNGKGLDIHKAILKVAPKKGFVLPGHKYTGPGNPLHKQLKWDNAGNILEIYEQPTGKTDAVSMQHDVDYSVCKDNVKCKNTADKKMVKSLDAIPYKQRQWGHALARNMIKTKHKIGLGTTPTKTKNGERR